MKKTFLIGVLSLLSIPFIYGQTYTTNGYRQTDGRTSGFELFKNFRSSDDKMTVTSQGRAFTGKWDNLGSDNGNILIRESRRNGLASSRTGVSYSYNIKSMSGNVYHGAYGWWTKFNSNGTRSNTVEFYVVEGWVNRDNPKFGMTYSGLSYNLDGGRYDVYYDEKRGQGSVYATSDNFLQIKAIRTSNKGTGRRSGRITMRRHFDNWRNFGSRSTNASIKKFGTRKIFEVSYVFEGFGRSSKIDFSCNAGFFNTNSKDLDAITNNDTSIYPNPSNGAFTVETDSQDQTTISIYDINGKLVSQTITDEESAVVNSDNSLVAGVYIVTIDNGSSTSNQKLIIN